MYEAEAAAHDVDETTGNFPQRGYSFADKSNVDRAVRLLFKLSSYCLLTQYGASLQKHSTFSYNAYLLFLLLLPTV